VDDRRRPVSGNAVSLRSTGRHRGFIRTLLIGLREPDRKARRVFFRWPRRPEWWKRAMMRPWP
jgi:hypothetical protein